MKNNTNSIKKRGKRVMTIFAIIFGVIVLLNLVSLFINQVFFSHELDNLTPYGELAEVNGDNMHVYSMGNSEKTIVLLPGFATPLPSADFALLMRALAKDYTVVSIEYFGIGFSNETNLHRRNTISLIFCWLFCAIYFNAAFRLRNIYRILCNKISGRSISCYYDRHYLIS